MSGTAGARSHHTLVEGLRFDRIRVFPGQRRDLLKERGDLEHDYPRDIPPVHGREVFSAVVSAISHDNSDRYAHQDLKMGYRLLQREHNHVLGHYFRNLYQVLKLIDSDASINTAEKQRYASVLRAQLSADEVALLAINCADTTVDNGEFRLLIVRYRMLEHLPLKRDESNYEYTGSRRAVVLFTDESIKQYLAEPNIPQAPKTYRGAFGTNPALEEVAR